MQSLRVLSTRLGWRLVSLKDSLASAVTQPWTRRTEKEASFPDFLHPHDRFIPTTRRELTGRLMQEKGLITPEEGAKFERFAVALDGALTSRNYKTLADLKVGCQVSRNMAVL